MTFIQVGLTTYLNAEVIALVEEAYINEHTVAIVETKNGKKYTLLQRFNSGPKN